jgi:hypothetical protein
VVNGQSKASWPRSKVLTDGHTGIGKKKQTLTEGIPIGLGWRFVARFDNSGLAAGHSGDSAAARTSIDMESHGGGQHGGEQSSQVRLDLGSKTGAWIVLVPAHDRAIYGQSMPNLALVFGVECLSTAQGLHGSPPICQAYHPMILT